MTMTSQSKSELAKREGSIWFVGGTRRTSPNHHHYTARDDSENRFSCSRSLVTATDINISKQKESVESDRNISVHGGQPEDDDKRARRRHRPTRCRLTLVLKECAELCSRTLRNLYDSGSAGAVARGVDGCART